MTSYVEMSLDDIIQKNRRDTRNRSKIKKNIPFQKQNPKVVDARNKIISKKRTKITDAREKLAELAKLKDARLKLQQMREKRLAMSKAKEGKNYHGHEMFLQPLYRKERVFIDSTRQVTSQPMSNLASNKHVTRSQNFNHGTNRFTANRTFGSRSIVNTYSLKPIVRTVENDIEVIDDPMDGQYVPRKSSSSVMNRKASLQLKIIAHNNDIHENKSVQRVIPDKEPSPPKPPSILKKRPMAALRNDKKDDKVEKPVLEYRIIVSNLRNTVTGGDIEELFGDVGGMQESRLVRPGTAEVLYKSLEDAQKAVDLYHNRQLDGQPMNCLLVTPRSTSTASRCSSKPALYSTNSNVEPDISTFHKVLFSNL